MVLVGRDKGPGSGVARSSDSNCLPATITTVPFSFSAKTTNRLKRKVERGQVLHPAGTAIASMAYINTRTPRYTIVARVCERAVKPPPTYGEKGVSGQRRKSHSYAPDNQRLLCHYHQILERLSSAVRSSYSTQLRQPF